MEKIEIKANAKINLYLHITKTREDGYHEIDSVFQSIDLFDYITLEKAKGISITCDVQTIPTDEKNTCYKGAKVFIDKTGVDGVKIDIQKKIPVCAGLGGGSSDVAAVLIGLNELYNCGLERAELMDIGKAIGADVPFFLEGGCQRATGIGEVLDQQENPFEYDIILIKPKGDVSTPKAYKLFDEIGAFSDNSEDMIKALEKKDEQKFLCSMKNSLEPCASIIAPDSKKASHTLIEAGAKKAMVTGSGSAVFGIFERGKGNEVLGRIDKTLFEKIFLTDFSKKGIEITLKD